MCEAFLFTIMVSRAQVIAAIDFLLDNDDKEKNENNQERTQWIILWLSKRQTERTYHILFQQLNKEDPENFINCTKLDILSFETLFEIQKPSFLIKNTANVTAIFHIKQTTSLSKITHSHWLNIKAFEDFCLKR